jgi:predicted RNase H-like HicB family nuclease
MKGYFAIIHKEKSSDYGISFPDLLGCVSAGKNPEEAVKMASEALALHIQGLKEDKLKIPNPSGLEIISKLNSDKKNTHAIIFIEPSKLTSKQVRVNISLDEKLLETADSLAQEKGLTRSSYLAVLIGGQLNSKDSSQNKKQRNIIGRDPVKGDLSLDRKTSVTEVNKKQSARDNDGKFLARKKNATNNSKISA